MTHHSHGTGAVHTVWDHALPPALTVGSGDTVTLHTLDFPGGERLAITHGGAYLDARLTLPDARRGRVRGVWGNFDGVTTNDLTTNDLTTRGGAALSSHTCRPVRHLRELLAGADPRRVAVRVRHR